MSTKRKAASVTPSKASNDKKDVEVNSPPEKQIRNTPLAINCEAQRLLSTRPIYPDAIQREVAMFHFSYQQRGKQINPRKRLITWQPLDGELFILLHRVHFNFSETENDQDIIHNSADHMHIESNHLSLDSAFLLDPGRTTTKNSTIYFPSKGSSKCFWVGNPSTQLRDENNSNSAFMCYIVFDHKGTARQNIKISVLDILMQNGQVLKQSEPWKRQLILANMRSSFPTGFLLQQTHKIEEIHNFAEGAQYASTIAHGLNGIIEFTENPLSPILMKRPQPQRSLVLQKTK